MEVNVFSSRTKVNIHFQMTLYLLKLRGFEPSKFGHVLEYPRVNKFIHLMILSKLLSLRIPMTSHDVPWCPMVANLQTMLRVGFDQLIVPRECIREHLIEPVQRYVCS